MLKSLMLLLCTFGLLAGADLTGTWKHTAKSKYEVMPMPKEMTVTITANGKGYDYMAMGTSAAGDAIHAMYTFVGGEEAKITGAPYYDALVIKHGMEGKAEIEFKRGEVRRRGHPRLSRRTGRCTPSRVK